MSIGRDFECGDFICHKVLCFLIGLTLILFSIPITAKALDKNPDTLSKIETPKVKTAEDLLLEAQAISDKYPDSAIQLLMECLALKPDEGKAYLLLGGIHEKAGRLPDALRAYMRAAELMKDNRDAADSVKRLAARTFKTENIWIFLPDGWVVEDNGISNTMENQRMTLNVSSGGDPETIAMKAAREAMPEGLFSDESLKSFQEMRAMSEEIKKSDPEQAKMMQSIPMPFFISKDFSGIAGARMVILSTSETAQPGIESACAVSVTKDGKIYLFVLKSHDVAAEGEKTMTDILSRILWPL